MIYFLVVISLSKSCINIGKRVQLKGLQKNNQEMRRWFLRPIPVLGIGGVIVFVILISKNFKFEDENSLPPFDFNYIKTDEFDKNNNGHE